MFYALKIFFTMNLYTFTRTRLDKASVADLRGTMVLFRAEVREFLVPKNVHTDSAARLPFIKGVRGRKTVGTQSWRLTVSVAEV
jgi:hypothetical protein